MMDVPRLSRALGAILAVLVAVCWFEASTRAQQDSWLDAYREPARRIIERATSSDAAWQRLAELGDTFGARLTASPAFARALQWALEQLKEDGLHDPHLEPVMVPRWERGAESLEIVEPSPQRLVVLGLGGSVGTKPEGIVAALLVVRSFEDLAAKAADASGRIVLFNVPFTSYGETVQYRSNAAVRAARYGAVAALVRSVGPPGLRTPHTGAMRYDNENRQIPAAAIPVEDAEQLQRMQDRGTRVTLRLRMEAKTLPDTESANLVADLRGRERPDEVVLLGCHFDSWDVGTGSTDDGGGCIAAWEALRLLKGLGLVPRRTLRAVFFVNEETEQRGGAAYRDRHRAELANHVLMIESDSGVFRPLGFGFSGSDRGRASVTAVADLLSGIGADRIGAGGGGADIGPSVQAAKVPSMSLDVDGSRYFIIHHTPADTVDKIDPGDLSRCVAALAVMGYVVADMPERLAR